LAGRRNSSQDGVGETENTTREEGREELLGGNMGYSEIMLEKISSMEERSDERKAIWEATVGSFEREGAEGVSSELTQQMTGVRERFDVLLDSLEQML